MFQPGVCGPKAEASHLPSAQKARRNHDECASSLGFFAEMEDRAFQEQHRYGARHFDRPGGVDLVILGLWGLVRRIWKPLEL